MWISFLFLFQIIRFKLLICFLLLNAFSISNSGYCHRQACSVIADAFLMVGFNNLNFRSPTYDKVISTLHQSTSSDQEWKGDVVPGGKISGCSLTQKDGSETEWTISIDGVEADLGRFSDVIYTKLIRHAKTQRFQGFRPGTIPPHLEPTYRAFAMDECARETVLEALQQNNIRPFESSRQDFEFVNISIPPPSRKGGSKKKSKRKNTALEASQDDSTNDIAWLSFKTMKEAIDAGWKPGQSFSFVAINCKGQKLRDESEIQGAKPLGLTY